MFPQTSNPTTTIFQFSVTTMPVNLPASISAGDILVAGTGVRIAGNWTPPGGWSLLEEKAGGGAVGETPVWYKIADGSEGATATWTAGTATTAAWHVYKITDHYQSSILGNNVEEASSGQLSGNILGNFITATESGEIESIVAYLTPTGTRNVVFGLYDASTDALIATTNPTSISGTGWHTAAFATPVSVSASTGYYILANADGSFQCTIARSALSGAGRFVAKAYDGTMPNPSGTGTNNFKYSIYARYKTKIEHATSNGDAVAVNPPSLTPSWGLADTLWIALVGSSATTMNFTAAPANYTGLVSSPASSGGGASNVGSARRENATATEDPGNFTVNQNRWWAAFTIAIRPGGGTPPVASPIKLKQAGEFTDALTQIKSSGSFAEITPHYKSGGSFN